MLDIQDFELNPPCDLVIKNPRTGQDTDVTFTIHGITSDLFRSAWLAFSKRCAKREIEASFEQLDDDFLADMTTGWANLTDAGKPLAFSREAAVSLYANPRMNGVRSQVRNAMIGTSNFLPNA
jgi:hypothetical protein